MRRAALLLPLATALALAGCITFHTVDDGISRAVIGETARVGHHTVVPQKLLEDSRCPTGVQCIQAGRVRISALVDGAEGELTLGAAASPVRLVEVTPVRRAGVTYYPDEYRFGFAPG